jgi:hypothetical protein
MVRYRDGRDLRKVEVAGELFLEPSGQPIDHAVLEAESDGINIMDRVASLTEGCQDGLEWYSATGRHLHTVETFLRDMRYQPAILDQGRTSVVAYMHAEYEARAKYSRGWVWH